MESWGTCALKSLIWPAARPVRPQVPARRARTGDRHRMTKATWSTPPARTAPFCGVGRPNACDTGKKSGRTDDQSSRHYFLQLAPPVGSTRIQWDLALTATERRGLVWIGLRGSSTSAGIDEATRFRKGESELGSGANWEMTGSAAQNGMAPGFRKCCGKSRFGDLRGSRSGRVAQALDVGY